MLEMNAGGLDLPPADILGMPPLDQRVNYLNHAAVDRQGGADHVDVGRGGGALPLGETTARRWVGRVVVEGVRGGIPMGRAANGARHEVRRRRWLLDSVRSALRRKKCDSWA